MHLSLGVILAAVVFFDDFARSSAIDESQLKLELLQVLFRHGDRTPSKQEVYKTDPYDDIWREIGYGQLTQIGKQREYHIGEILRRRYNTFLGDFNYDAVHARSTDYDRTKMSLQLVLAALYPPSRSTAWSKSVLWSPIPAHYKPLEDDFLFSFLSCPQFGNMLAEIEKTPRIQDLLRRNRGLIEHLQRYTGTTFDRFTSFAVVWLNLRSVRSLGLRIPAWCTEQVYTELEELAAVTYDLLTETNIMKKISAGPTIERFLKNMDDQNSGISSRKFIAYSAHDINVKAFTNAHNFSGLPRIADFGSTVVVEKLRDLQNRVYVRMFLWTGVSEQWLPLKVPGCDFICPLADYKRLIQPVLPNAESRQCGPKIDTPCSNAGKYRLKYSSIAHDETSELISDPVLRHQKLFCGDDVYSFKYGKQLFGERL